MDHFEMFVFLFLLGSRIRLKNNADSDRLMTRKKCLQYSKNMNILLPLILKIYFLNQQSMQNQLERPENPY